MMAQAKPATVDLSSVLRLAEPHRDRILIFSLLALAAHAAFSFVPYGEGVRPAAVTAPPVEVELPLVEPAPEVPETMEPPKPSPSRDSVRPLTRAAAPAPAAAQAPAVRTALPTAEPANPNVPFDFTSDPNSTSFGVGVVAVGGRATRGLAGATQGGTSSKPTKPGPAKHAQANRGGGLVPLADLARLPRLPASDPCSGYFPSGASHDAATVAIRVVLTEQGNVRSASIVSESVPGQGFGRAARTCMLQQRFSPGLDRTGRPRATAVAVNVHFRR